MVYRDKKQAENFLFELGEAVAVDVKAERGDAAGDACRATRFESGDYVALRTTSPRDVGLKLAQRFSGSRRSDRASTHPAAALARDVDVGRRGR